jgi:hypothetical protein
MLDVPHSETVLAKRHLMMVVYGRNMELKETLNKLHMIICIAAQIL